MHPASPASSWLCRAPPSPGTSVVLHFGKLRHAHGHPLHPCAPKTHSADLGFSQVAGGTNIAAHHSLQSSKTWTK